MNPQNLSCRKLNASIWSKLFMKELRTSIVGAVREISRNRYRLHITAAQALHIDNCICFCDRIENASNLRHAVAIVSELLLDDLTKEEVSDLLASSPRVQNFHAIMVAVLIWNRIPW